MTSPAATDGPWQWPPEERVDLGLVFIDRVGSTKESQTFPEEAVSRRQTQFQAGVEDIARAYGAYERFNWQGDGLMLLLWSEDAGSLAQTVAEMGMELWQRVHVELSMQARIAGHVVAGVTWGSDPGKLKHREIDLCGHLEKDAPDGGLLISEDVYWLLAPHERDKFGHLGASIRDATEGYCFPSNKVSEAFQVTQESLLWGKLRRYVLGPEIATVPCMGFPLAKQVPRHLQVEEVFVQPGFEFVQDSLLDRGDTLRIRAPEGPYDLVPTTEGLAAVPVPKVSAFGEAISPKKGLVVLGEPGAGKSMLLRWLAVIAARGRYSFQRQTGLDERRLPIPVSVGRLAEIKARLGGPCSVPQALALYFQDRSVGNAGELQGFLESVLEQGRCLVLLDGLDEVAGAKVEITSWLESFVSIYPGNRCVASSRIVGYSGFRMPEFHEIRLTSFSDEQVERYLDGFHRACLRDEQRARDQTLLLVGEIRADTRLTSVVRNPFMLLTLALIHMTERRLPRHRVQFYQIAARTLCETWASARRLVPGEARAAVHYEEEALPILGALASAMHAQHPEGAAPEDWVIETLANALGEHRGLVLAQAREAARAFLAKAGKEAGLLCERGAGAWGFLHFTFLEYFVVAGLHAREEFQKQAIDHLFEPRWEEILRLGAGYLALVQGRPKAAGAFVEQVAQASAPPPADWISVVLRKQVAIAALVGAEVEESMDAGSKERVFAPFLGWALEMPERISDRYLREIGATSREALAPFIQMLLSHPESEKRAKAAWAAGIIGDKSLGKPLLALLDDVDAEVRRHSALSLGALSESAALDALLNRLMADPDGDVRAACAEALGSLYDDRAIPAIRDAWSDPDQEVVNAAVAAAMRIDVLAALRFFAKQKSELSPGVLAAFLSEWRWWTTAEDAERLLSDPDAEIRMTALKAMSRCWAVEPSRLRDQFLPLLKRALADPDKYVRFWAVTALDGQKPEERIALLREAGKDPSDFVAGAAIEELAQLDRGTAEEVLLARKTSGLSQGEWTACATVEILDISDDENARALATMAQKPRLHSSVRARLLRRLWRISERGLEAQNPKQLSGASADQGGPAS
jgi:HEAT repeat protein